MLANVGAVIRSVVDAVNVLVLTNVALIVVAPCATTLASPEVEPIVATDVFDELQLRPAVPLGIVAMMPSV
jgi:hypothetical protein